MKSTTDKCHLLVISRSPVRSNIEGHAINNSMKKLIEEKLIRKKLPEVKIS